MAALLRVNDKLIINLDFVKNIEYDTSGNAPVIRFNYGGVDEIHPELPDGYDMHGEEAERTWKWLQEHTDGPPLQEAEDNRQTQADEGTNRFASALDTGDIDDAS